MQDHTMEDGDDATRGLTTVERALLQRELAAMPDAPPPRDVWQRIRAQAEAEGLFERRTPRGAARWFAGFGLAAAVALAVLQWPQGSRPPAGAETFPTEPRYVAGAEIFPTEPGHVSGADAGSLDALRVRSQWLERSLRSLPQKPHLMRAGTAATLGELEDRIAAIDAALNDPVATPTPQEEQVYWRERVRLMDALVQVRYAQARRNSM